MQKRAAEWWLPGVDYTRVYHTRTIAAMAIYTVLLNVLQCATDVHGATRQQLAPITRTAQPRSASAPSRETRPLQLALARASACRD